MSPKQRAADRQRRLEEALYPLIGDPRFDTFLSEVRQLRDAAVDFAITHESVKSDRATLSALGEVRAYTDLLNIAENYKAQLEARMEQEAEQAEVVQMTSGD